MRLLAAGLNHKTAPIEVRERLALHPTRQVEVLRELCAGPGVAECLVLSTCNRFEVYAAAPVCGSALDVHTLTGRATDIDSRALDPHLYVYDGLHAARHLFEVASGADSMVLGETEIMSQVKQAADVARAAGTLGTALSRLMDKALEAAKRARSETSIDEGCASVASIAVGLARQICGDPCRSTVLLLGAGETAELTLQRLLECGTPCVFIANRTISRARGLAEECGGQVVPFADIYQAMAETDVVIASTSAPHPVVHTPQMQQVVKDRGARPLFIIDLAVPRDVEPQVGDLENVFLYNIDSLQEAVDEALKHRESQLPRVRAICAEAAAEYWAWASSLDLIPTILGLRDRAESIRQQEFDRALGLMGDLTPRQRKHLHLLSKRLVQGLIDEPLRRLRRRACEGDGLAYLDVLRELFDLPEGEGDAAEPSGDSEEDSP
jgi:glutamyl-tRNA reductase